MMNRYVSGIWYLVLILVVTAQAFGGQPPRDKKAIDKLPAIRTRVAAYAIDPAFRDDIFALHVVKAALASALEGSGGIGACLVDAKTGQVVETGRNRQYTTYFRSDLHAEMDLLNQYENRTQKKRDPEKGTNPRDCPGLVLVSSVEPCPMCLTRIINSGIKTVIYVEADPEGGMAGRITQLPPFWQDFAADREFRQADCSPEIRQLAHDLFHLSNRGFAKNRKKTAN
jgi:cytosine deaminase